MDTTPRIPLHVLTGFLGSGKTTVLAALLARPEGERVAVLVNEVGDLALDQLLLEEGREDRRVERIDEDVLALSSGCVCCTVRGELYAAIERVVRLRPTRIVLETTGLADPAPILHGLATDPRLASLALPAGVVTVVDAPRAEDLLLEQPEVARQLELADKVVLTKLDLAPDEARVRSLVERAAPGREVRAADHGRVDPTWLFDAPPFGRLREVADARAWLHHGGAPGAPRPTASFRAHAFRSDDAADIDALALWLRLVTQLDGPRLLRVKLLAACRETGDAVVLQSAGRAVCPPRRLTRPPTGWRGVQGVLVERGLDERAVPRLLGSLRDAAEGRRTRSRS